MAIDFRLRDFLYPVGLYRLHRQFERTQWLPPKELRAYQERCLAMTLDRAFTQVPYYRQLLVDLDLSPSDFRGIDDLPKLPVLTKDTLRKANQALVADDAARFHPCICRTSGTSGAPLSLYFDKQANILEFVYYWRHWSWAGYRLGDRFAELGSVFFLKRDRLSEMPSYWQPHLRRLMLNSGQISLGRAAEMVQAIREHQPLFMKGLASAVYFLALCIKESGITDMSFKAVFSTGKL